MLSAESYAMPLRPDPFEFDPHAAEERRGGMSPRTAFRIELSLCILFAAFALLTLVWPDWIESVVGFDPDQHNGAVEWTIVGVMLGAALFFGIVARRQRAGLHQG
jgi:hypothetical protein